MSEIIVARVPAVWSAKLPHGRWVNLAHIREMSVLSYSYRVYATVVWESGDKDIFQDEQAQALIDAWERAHPLQRDIDEGDSDID